MSPDAFPDGHERLLLECVERLALKWFLERDGVVHLLDIVLDGNPSSLFGWAFPRMADCLAGHDYEE